MQGNLTNPTAPYSSIDYASLAFPSYVAPTGGVCNGDLPDDSTLNRYLFVVQYYVQQVGFTPLPVRWGLCMVSLISKMPTTQ